MQHIVCRALILGALFSFGAQVRADPDEGPNVVFVFVDDMGYADLGCYGNPNVKTPSIDKLASEGRRFTQFYVASPICSPSRVGVMTGQYPARHKIHSFLASRQRNRARGMADFLDPKVETVGRTFQNAGYATAHFGKWHLGGGRDVGDAPLPQKYGFEESLVSFEGLGDRVLPEGGGKASAKLGRGKISYAPKHKLTQIYVDRSIDFITRNKGKRFYLHLWLNDVHDAHRPSEAMLKKYERIKDNPYVQRFYAVLDEMDRQIGRLVAAIDKLELDQDTLIVLTSDNGPTAWPRYEREGFDAPGHVGDLRGRKWSLYEGGIREPLIVRWKGKVPAGGVDETSIIGAVDLFPTFCSLAKIKPPKWDFDGVDVGEAFLGKPVTRRKPLYWEYGRNETYLRPALPIDQSPNLAMRYDRWKLLMNADGSRMELYDLSESKREFDNVAGKYPNVAASLSEKLLAWKSTIPGYDAGTKTELQSAKSIKLKQGQSVRSERFPAVSEAAITINATVTTKGKDGVILAHGGTAAGYSLFVKNGKLGFTVRARNEATTISASDTLAANEKVEIVARLTADRALSLEVNGEGVAKGKCPILLNVQPVDPADAGFDSRGNVGPYEGDFRFGGSIHELSVTTQQVKQAAVVGRLVTRWAKDVDPKRPLPEYPRPQMKRKRWLNLNGHWQYAIRPKDAEQPNKWDGRIVVPFAIESQLSGVQKQVGKDKRLWYRRTFTVPKVWRDARVLLHFGAVDWETTVWINGKNVGAHRGGYDPFSFDVTKHLRPEKEQEIVVSVWDPTNAGPQPRGKQLENPRGIWYTPVTGIWQSVWIEPTPKNAIRSLRIVPDLDASAVKITVDSEGSERTFSVSVLDGGKIVTQSKGAVDKTLVIPIENAKPWSPTDPHLYELKITVGDDVVESYFGMRKIELRKDKKGIDRLFLNNKAVFHLGLLDQGWWPDGLYTAPTDAALRYDIEMTKAIGFNVARKHVKVEPARWYYWADKLGVMVWQDMPSAMQTEGAKAPARIKRGAPNDATIPAEAKKQFREELKAMIDALRNHPSIVIWVTFNEGWGQHDTNDVLKWVKEYDATRLVGGPSGWEDRGYGDLKDLHRYPGPDAYPPVKGRASVLGEFGGLGLPVNGHLWVTKNNWGYRTYKTRGELNDAFAALLEKLPALIDKGLAAAIYTQTTDVEVEVNGVLTYDRALLKLDRERVRRLAKQSVGDKR